MSSSTRRDLADAVLAGDGQQDAAIRDADEIERGAPDGQLRSTADERHVAAPA